MKTFSYSTLIKMTIEKIMNSIYSNGVILDIHIVEPDISEFAILTSGLFETLLKCKGYNILKEDHINIYKLSPDRNKIFIVSKSGGYKSNEFLIEDVIKMIERERYENNI